MRNTGFTKVYRSAKYPYFLLSFFSSTNTNYIFFPGGAVVFSYCVCRLFYYRKDQAYEKRF